MYCLSKMLPYICTQITTTKFLSLKLITMENLISTFETTGKVNTHYFNGYGFTNKTKQVKEKLEEKGLVNGVDFEIKNIMGQNTRTKIIKKK